jgi:ATP-dependent DNA helicase MPH1
MCYRALLELGRDPEQEPGKKKKAPNKIQSDQNYVLLMREFERLKTREDEFQPHPKIEKLKALVLQHFANAQNEEPEEDGSTETRAMVFAQYRDAVDEIVEELNKEQPMIRAERFVGQGLDKAGKKGITQKDQIELLSRFKAGVFNVLVSTSIGEEGLDIGDVDLIVCFDAQKTPGRMVNHTSRSSVVWLIVFVVFSCSALVAQVANAMAMSTSFSQPSEKNRTGQKRRMPITTSNTPLSAEINWSCFPMLSAFCLDILNLSL